MIKSLTVTNYLNQSLELDLFRPERTGIAITDIDGLGPPKADIATMDMATSDGFVYNSARVKERNIVIKMKFIANDAEEIRLKTYKYFPLKKKITLSVVTNSRTVYIDGYVESNESDIFTKEAGCQISILCGDVYFKDSIDQTTIFYGVEPMFEFPFSNESLTEPLIEFASIQNKTEQFIYYEGDAETGIKITMDVIGEVHGITIYDLSRRLILKIDTDKIATITGSGLVAGDELILDTNRGIKTLTLLRSGEYINVRNALERNPPWFVLSKGDNRFAYTATVGLQNLQFKIENHILYEGV